LLTSSWVKFRNFFVFMVRRRYAQSFPCLPSVQSLIPHRGGGRTSILFLLPTGSKRFFGASAGFPKSKTTFFTAGVSTPPLPVRVSVAWGAKVKLLFMVAI
jgi:hypothetical protein